MRAQHPVRAEIQSPEKCALRWVNAHVNNFLVCGPKFTRFLLSNVGGVVVDHLLFRFSICGSVPEIFTIKVESCQKSRKILDGFFALPNFRGQALEKLHPGYNPWLAARRLDKNLWYIPISSELIDVYTLNIKPNNKFSRLNNWGDPHPSWGVR